MWSDGKQHAVLLAVVLTSGALGACRIAVDHDDRPKSVDIRTPLGGLTAKTDPSGQATGLPIYPGARPVADDAKNDSGDVDIDTPLFRLKVATATFDVEAAPDTVLSFYRDALGAYGSVTACRGNVEFRGRRSQRATCRDEGWFEDEVQLAVGPEDAPRIAKVKPRGRGTRFTLVTVDARQRS